MPRSKRPVGLERGQAINLLQQNFPGFIAGTQHLQQAFIAPAMLICLCGFAERVVSHNDIESIGRTFLRLIIVAILIFQVPFIVTLLTDITNGIVQTAGFSLQSNMLQTYQQDLSTKFNISPQGNLWDWLLNAANLTGLSFFGSLTYYGSLFAWGMMLLMLFFQQVLFALEVAFSPLFLACIMCRPIFNLAVRWATALVAVSLWVLGFAVCDLLMKFLLDLASNPTNGAAQTVANFMGGYIIFWIAAAVVAVIGYPLSAIFISRAIVTNGTHGLHNFAPWLFGVSTGMAMSAYRYSNLGMSIGNQVAGRPAPSAAVQTHHIRPGMATSAQNPPPLVPSNP